MIFEPACQPEARTAIGSTSGRGLSAKPGNDLHQLDHAVDAQFLQYFLAMFRHCFVANVHRDADLLGSPGGDQQIKYFVLARRKQVHQERDGRPPFVDTLIIRAFDDRRLHFAEQEVALGTASAGNRTLPS